MNVDSALMVVVAIAVLWFGTRMMMGKRGSGPSLGGMFRREAALPKIGLGPEAIRTMIEDTTELVRRETHLRGLILAGPFAAKGGDAEANVEFVLLSDTPADYATGDWLGRWTYRARGHDIRDHRTEIVGDASIHRLRLRGAPPVIFHIVAQDTAEAPEATKVAINRGALVIETGTDAARRALTRWQNGNEQGEHI